MKRGISPFVIASAIVVIAVFAALLTKLGSKLVPTAHAQLTGVQAGCHEDISPLDSPAMLTALQDIKNRHINDVRTAAPWDKPTLLTGQANTVGWEDSPYVLPHGRQVAHMYAPLDLFNVGNIFSAFTPQSLTNLLNSLSGSNLLLYQQYFRGPWRNVNPLYTSDVFVETKAMDGSFCNPTKLPFSQDARSEHGPMYGPDGNWYFVAQDQAVSPTKDIYRYANSISAPLPIPGWQSFNEDDPHFAVTQYGAELFFWSDDRPGNGQSWIYVTKQLGPNQWSDPVPLAPPINVSYETQPHLTADGKLYFTSTRDNTISIWVANRTAENAWGNPQRVVWAVQRPPGQPRVFGVGEPTLTQDGEELYAVAIFAVPPYGSEAEMIKVARR